MSQANLIRRAFCLDFIIRRVITKSSSTNNHDLIQQEYCHRQRTNFFSSIIIIIVHKHAFAFNLCRAKRGKVEVELFREAFSSLLSFCGNITHISEEGRNAEWSR